MRRRDEAAGEGEPGDRRHRRRQVQDLRLRQRHREFFAGHGMAARQDGGRSAGHQEHRHRQRAEPAAGEDSLLGAGGGRDQGGHRGLQSEGKTVSGRDGQRESNDVWSRSLPKQSVKFARRSQREGVNGGLRLGVLGGGCSGLSYQFKFDVKPRPTDRCLNFDDVKVFIDPKSLVYLRWHDARLERFADPVGIRVRESQRQEELRLRDIFFCLMQFYDALGLAPEARAGFGRTQEALLRAQPPVASRPLQPGERRRTAKSARNDVRAQRRLPYIARPRRARRVFPASKKGIVPSKHVPPELLEEVFEMNMALEELRSGDESARPQLAEARERFIHMRDEIDTELECAVRALRRRR